MEYVLFTIDQHEPGAPGLELISLARHEWEFSVYLITDQAEAVLLKLNEDDRNVIVPTIDYLSAKVLIHNAKIKETDLSSIAPDIDSLMSMLVTIAVQHNTSVTRAVHIFIEEYTDSLDDDY